MSEDPPFLACSSSGSTAVDAEPVRAMGRRRWWIATILVMAFGIGVLVWGVIRIRRVAPSLAEVEKLIAADRYAEAQRLAEAVVAADPIEPRALFALARARAGSNDMKGLIAALSQVPDWSRRKPEALFRIGQAWRVLNRGRDAEKAFEACVALEPDDPNHAMDARVELLKLYAIEERREAFLKLVWHAYERIPEQRRIHLLTMRMRIEYEQAKPEVNRQVSKAFVDQDPDDVYARAGLASALDRAGDLATARVHFAKAVDGVPDDAELRERYLDLLFRMGDLPALRSVLADRPRSSDQRPKTAKFLGFVAEKDGDLASAAHAYASAARADPSDPESLYRLSQVLNRAGKKDEAALRAAEHARQSQARGALRKAWDEFADAYESNPPRVTSDLLLGMARACESYGWSREAAAWYREALQSDPNDTQAHDGLERVLSSSPIFDR